MSEDAGRSKPAERERGRWSLLRFVAVAGLVFLTAYTVALLLRPSEPYLRIQSNVIYNIPPLLALGLSAIPIRRSHGRRRLGWVCLAVLLIAWQIADWTFSYYDLVLDTEPPFPGYADVAYYAGYLAFIAAVPLLTFPERKLHDQRWMIDAVIIMVVAGAISWAYLLDPIVTSAGYDRFSALIALGYPLLDLGLLTALVVSLYASGARFSRRALVLAAATVANIAADAVYTYTVTTIGYDNVGNPLELGWLAGYILFAVCFVLPEEGVEERAPSGQAGIGLVLPYVAVLPLGVLALVGAVRDQLSHVLIAGAMATMALILLRQFLTLRENLALYRKLERTNAELRESKGRYRRLVEALIAQLQSPPTHLTQARTETVMLLAATAEAHDRTTGLHLQSMRALTEALAQELGYSAADAKELGLAAVLHDIGKIWVPNSVLSSSGRLSDQEWELMKQHTVWGEEFLAGRPGFELAAAIARSHHEHWDGSGYPGGLSGEAIPESAAIVAVADSVDAMTHDRPYRTGRTLGAAVREIGACAGTQFSPRVVAALQSLYRRNRLPFALGPGQAPSKAAAA